MNVALKWHEDDDNPGRAYAEGGVTIDGHDVHVFALRVKIEDGVQYAFEEEHESELELLYNLAPTRMEAHALPGLDGEWVVGAFSFSD